MEQPTPRSVPRRRPSGATAWKLASCAPGGQAPESDAIAKRPAVRARRVASFPYGAEDVARLRALADDTTDALADEAESIADDLEDAATGADRERKLSIAATEREIAATLRRNGARLRQFANAPANLEPLPRLLVPHADDGVAGPCGEP